jgi:hypothetical protein
MSCRSGAPSIVVSTNSQRPKEDHEIPAADLPGGDALRTQAQLSETDQQRVWADYAAIREAPGVTPGEGLGLPETATTVRVEDGRALVTDGPFADTKEALGGYFLFECESLDDALELAARVPAARYGGAVEVRPIVEW